MKWHRAFNGLITGAALLLPLTAVPESQIETGTASTAPSATAHVNFKIVIPRVLYLRVGAGSDGITGNQTMAVVSNGRNVTVNSTDRTADSNSPVRRNVILNASAGKPIAQEAQCAPTPAPAGDVPADSRDSTKIGTRSMICTASMP